MSLRTQAALDHAAIVEDTTGFGWPIQLTSPIGKCANLVGLSNDVAQVIDMDTDQVVVGRVATLRLALSSLEAANMRVPRAIAADNEKPWLVKFDNVSGKTREFKIADVRHDETLGCIDCILEAYKP